VAAVYIVIIAFEGTIKMIVWRGAGIVVLVFLFLPPAVLGWNMQLWPNNRLEPWQDALVLVTGYVLGGAVCIFLGRRLNRDARTTGAYHDLYFLRVEHWGLIMLALAAVMVVGFPLGLFDPPRKR
jgi:membrane protein YqaA with SNARE-associated domain